MSSLDPSPIDDVPAPLDAGKGAAPPRMEKYFEAMGKHDASDLHIKPGQPPHFRIRSKIRSTRNGALSAEETAAMAYELMTAKHRKTFEDLGSVDVAYEVPDGDRFRTNIFRQRGNIAMSIRRVTREIPSFEEINLPASIEQIAHVHQGLVLLAGPTGCGKSTTIAAMIDSINRARACHIVTIEDPIEYLFEDKKALVSQREIGVDVESFEVALKYLMREDPDVVLIGEMRDRDTFQSALQAAETGHLVFGTVHASSAGQTINRILNLFPSEDRPAYRQTLAANLRAVICQLLMPSVAEGVDRVPAIEILRSNPTVRQLIEEERDSELLDVIRAGQREGMLSFSRSLMDLIENNYIDPKTAYEYAPNVEELKMLMKGIAAGQSGLIGRR